MGGSHIKEYVSNGPKQFEIGISDCKQIGRVNHFTLNDVASTTEHWRYKDMAISDEQHSIKIVERPQILKRSERQTN